MGENKDLKREHAASRATNDRDSLFLNNKEVTVVDNQLFCNGICLNWQDCENLIDWIDDANKSKGKYKIESNWFIKIFNMIVPASDFEYIFWRLIGDLIPR